MSSNSAVSLMLVVAIVMVMQMGCAAAGPENGLDLAATLEKDLVRVKVAGETFTCYKFARTEKYPYFYPVNGPMTNKSLTTETSQPYPHHHSLFFGCDHVSGGNYWQAANQAGQIISKGPKIVEAKGKRVIIEDNTQWRRRGAPSPFTDKRTIVITAPCLKTRIIDFTITMKAEIDVHITKTNHSLFSARMKHEMCVKSGGRLINAEGRLDQKGTCGPKSAWCDYSNKHGDHVEGLAILDWPKNPWSPCPWVTRDYGFFSPTPMNYLGAEGMRFKKGQTITLKYRVVVHTGNEKDADIAGAYAAWIKPEKSK